MVKTAINAENEKELRGQLKTYSKLRDWVDEEYQKKEYLKTMTLEESRLNFRIRSKMTEFAFNFRNKKEYSDALWICSSCNMAIDTFSHAKWCVAHSDLRQNKDLSRDEDLVKYVQEVLKRRERGKGQRAETVTTENSNIEQSGT